MTESIFVTGAARGIGAAIVRKFAAAGYRVGAVDLDAAGLDELKAHADQQAWQVWTSVMDVTDADAWTTTLGEFVGAETKGGLGQLNILVNNAGVMAAGDFVDVPVHKHKLTVDVNVTGVTYGCHAAFPYLRETPGARVLNLCSASAIYGQPELASYSASKFYVRGLTEALDLEWRKFDISVRDLWPLFVNSDMLAGVRTGSTDTLGVRLTPEDIADAAWRVLQRKPGGLKVHFPVGAQTSAAYYLSQFSPPWLTRLVNSRFAH